MPTNDPKPPANPADAHRDARRPADPPADNRPEVVFASQAPTGPGVIQGTDTVTRNAAVDLESVSLMSGYRVGFRAPAEGSLVSGEMYLELGEPTEDGTPPAGYPKMWVGSLYGGLGLLGGETPPPARAARDKDKEPEAPPERHRDRK